MRRGATPAEATKIAIERITTHYPKFMGAVIALTKTGQHGASCHGINEFPYVVKDASLSTVTVVVVQCNQPTSGT